MNRFVAAAGMGAALIAACAATPAFAKKPPAAVADGHGASFVTTYLQCKKTAEVARAAPSLDKLACEERVSMHFCSLFQGLPKDAQDSIALEVYCNFLADQQNGEDAHDADIITTANAAGCFHGGDSRGPLLEKYKADEETLDALQNFTKALITNEEQCTGKHAKE